MASTKRNPAVSSGRVTIPVTCLATLTLAHPIMPVDPETAEKYHLQAPRKSYITGAFAVVDVAAGDILTEATVDYIVRAVAKWGAPREYTKIIMERVD